MVKMETIIVDLSPGMHNSAVLSIIVKFIHVKVHHNMQMMIAYSSLYSSFVAERVGERIGLSCLFALLLVAFLGTGFERKYNDLRLCMAFQLIPSIAIPGMTCLFQPKYTHSRYWLFAAGAHILAKFEGVADRKIYRANRYFISGHSLEHLCLAMVPVLLSVMLMYRRMKFQRLGDYKERL